ANEDSTSCISQICSTKQLVILSEAKHLFFLPCTRDSRSFASLRMTIQTYGQIHWRVQRGSRPDYRVEAIFIAGSPISSCDSPSRQTRCHSSRLRSRQMRS